MEPEHENFIQKAESKILFIGFCFEYRKYINALHNNASFYTTHFPIQLDATCNGYQHLALLIGEDSLADRLNLKSSSEIDVPDDFYTFISIKLREYFTLCLTDPDLDSSKKHSLEQLLKLDIHRKLVKTSIMVKPYNASLFQMCNYIKEQFKEVLIDHRKMYIHPDTPSVQLNEGDFLILTKAIDKVLYSEFPKILEFNVYLKKIAEICATLNITIV